MTSFYLLLSLLSFATLNYPFTPSSLPPFHSIMSTKIKGSSKTSKLSKNAKTAKPYNKPAPSNFKYGCDGLLFDKKVYDTVVRQLWPISIEPLLDVCKQLGIMPYGASREFLVASLRRLTDSRLQKNTGMLLDEYTFGKSSAWHKAMPDKSQKIYSYFIGISESYLHELGATADELWEKMVGTYEPLLCEDVERVMDNLHQMERVHAYVRDEKVHYCLVDPSERSDFHEVVKELKEELRAAGTPFDDYADDDVIYESICKRVSWQDLHNPQ